MLKQKLLMIDDDQLVLVIQKKLIKNHLSGVDILAYDKAKLALDYIKKLKSKELDKLSILLDLNMPEMSGWKFLEELRKIDNHQLIKIYILTSSVDQRDRKWALKEELVREFFIKPLDKKKIQKLKEHMMILEDH